MRGIRKRLGALFIGVAVPLVLASAAYACASLATLSIDPERGRPGATITGKGGNYSSDPAASTVTLHFKSRSGPVLWEGRPSAERKIAFEFEVPDAAPGWYSVIAVQNKADGNPVAGTPGRSSLKVRATATNRGSSIPPVWSADQTPPRADAPTRSGVDLPVSSGILFAAAFASLAFTIGMGAYWKKTGKLSPTTAS